MGSIALREIVSRPIKLIRFAASPLGRSTRTHCAMFFGDRVGFERADFESGLDRGKYPVGVVVTDQQIARIKLAPHSLQGDWNYMIRPTRRERA